MCGTIQLTVDIMIVLQIINYRKGSEKSYETVEAPEES